VSGADLGRFVAVPLLAAALSLVGAAETQPPKPSIEPSTAAGDTPARGRAIYERHCAACHGLSGHGDGPADPLLDPHATDFTTGNYKFRSTPLPDLPTDQDLVRSVSQGLPGSSMIGWEGLLSPGDIEDVVQYIKSFSPRFATEQRTAIVPGPPVASSPESIERGRVRYLILNCNVCHGSEGRGTNALKTTFKDARGNLVSARDLSRPWSFRGGATTRDIYLRVRTGISKETMGSFEGMVLDDQLWDLANYVLSLSQAPSMTESQMSEAFARDDAEAKANPVARGQYLVESIGCAVCHSPLDKDDRILPGLKMAGGQRIHVEPFGDYVTGNLTSDRNTGLGSWSDGAIAQALTRGIRPDGSRMLPYPMDWASYSTMRPEDVQAIIKYLRTLPPISNAVPRSTPSPLPAFLWGKFKMLVLRRDPAITFFPGNAGIPGGGRR
jgi:mono/diheme cytochrome c family protein